MTIFSSVLSFLRRGQLLAVFLCLPVAASAAETHAWVLLMQNPDKAQSLISISKSEKDHLVSEGWKLTGEGTLSMDAGQNKMLLTRMLRMEPDIARRVATSPEEIAANTKEGFISEGGLGYALTSEEKDAVPVHRFSKGDRLIWVSGGHEQYWADHNGWKREPGIFWLKAIR